MERTKSDASDYDEFVEQDPTGRYYRYDDVLGKGAFKTVYKAFDEDEGIEVAWSKVKPADDAELHRLFSEIDLLKSLKHDNIIKIFSWWVSEDDGKGKKKKTVNMITELFTSGSLKQYRKKHTNVEVKAIKKWARQILKGLSYLHSHDPPIVHRDLKCDNVFINGFNGEVKIGDFGFALVMHGQGSTEHEVIGTPEFIAPEMYEENYNELVDIYSFGSQVKQFIEKCLVPASRRLSAIELLDDPFLAADDSKVPRSFPMDIDTASDRVSSKSSSSSILECHRFTKNNALTLRAKRNSDSSKAIALTLSVAGSRGKKKTIEFDFYPNSDTAVSIAGEMVDQELGLSTEDVSAVAELIDRLVMKIVPMWRPTSSVGAYSSCTTTSSYSTKNSVVSSMEIWKSFSTSSNCSLQSAELSLLDKHHYDNLKAEIDSIDAQFQQRFVELVEKKEEAIQSAKKKLVGPV
uniref:serine/threonine-protein kinase WNK8-like n=1 Tax=Fragaria vesca subsp. vesca TaxID=101020 RepID=UPI0005C89496|nr:PREDICTED: serine/threonine-protein kinase WNK8-like [Fragaria vesca subsp. vesca]